MPFFIEEYRFRSDESMLLKLEGIDTQEQARELTNCEVFFPRSMAKSQEEGISWAQIVGFRIVNGYGLGFGNEVLAGAMEELNDEHRPVDGNLIMPPIPW